MPKKKGKKPPQKAKAPPSGKPFGPYHADRERMKKFKKGGLGSIG
jgi:hypothetical protein